MLAQVLAISGATAGRYFTFSVWLKRHGSAAAIGLVIGEDGGAQPSAYASTSVTPPVSGWQKFTFQKKIVENDRTGITVYISATGYASTLYAWRGTLAEGSAEPVNLADANHSHVNGAGQIVTSGAGSSHTHSLTGQTAGVDGEPARLVLLPYFRL